MLVAREQLARGPHSVVILCAIGDEPESQQPLVLKVTRLTAAATAAADQTPDRTAYQTCAVSRTCAAHLICAAGLTCTPASQANGCVKPEPKPPPDPDPDPHQVAAAAAAAGVPPGSSAAERVLREARSSSSSMRESTPRAGEGLRAGVARLGRAALQRSSTYQVIPNTEHMAYMLVRVLVYKRVLREASRNPNPNSNPVARGKPNPNPVRGKPNPNPNPNLNPNPNPNPAARGKPQG
eukprot:scaffold36829_cov59-Phaeocystis_antarctica.AAC.2